MKHLEFKANDPKTIIIALIVIVGLIFFFQGGKASPTNATQTPVVPINKLSIPEKQGKYPQAAELSGIAGYINAPQGFKLSDVAGKVILVDFWTYSCINCIRTQPYLNAWHEKYADKGLVIVGVHTPEFDFEKELANVQEAVVKENIKYPVVLDNDFSTWTAYKNRYWPRKYLIDADGFIRYDHIGEGAYEETEAMIQQLLRERDEKIGLESEIVAENIPSQTGQDFSQIGTPEIYLGYDFARAQLGSPQGFQPNQIVTYSIPPNNEIQPNAVYLEGEWKNNSDSVELVSETGKVVLLYKAKALNIVAGNPAELSVRLDENPLTPENRGEDVSILNGKGTVSVEEEKLYNLVASPNYDPHLIEILVSGKGFQLYTFTFG
ncbi:MAG: redoxin domain-containing protein [Candidatus Iainarchaeum archaeon]|uniref:Redoxin domain-containing protein n=1 Tax=Candidatus Iainarchaeum sp. TaxID=3101447 RepID=A0A7T9DKN6_9ARCH|nr:MAG: redoxin domain-containing protein [Candidatus Diapherotrites archaeon]